MKTPTTHISRTKTALILLVLCTAALAAPALTTRAGSAGTTPAAAAGRSYGWPVAPFDRQHPVRGSFGDPRTVYNAPPTRATLYHGSGSFSFHQGIDICAPDGTRVYPVVDGTVSALNKQKVIVDSGGGNRFEYWHIKAAVRTGDHVTARKTVLGRILRGSGHVHLTEIDGGRVTNPLQPGHLTPYKDKTTPTISSLRFQESDEAPALMPNFLRGRVAITAEVYDTPTISVCDEWRDMPMTPSTLTWRIETWNGRTVLRTRTAWDVRRRVPVNGTFWDHYAHGTYQNMAVFYPHFSWGQPGSYVFRITTLDTRRLRDGVYRLVVTASDIQGNDSSASQRFSVHNDPGWVGV